MTAAASETAPKRSLGGWIWLALMVGAWCVFFGLLAASEPTLADLWEGIRDLPLLVEAVIWIAFFPLVLGPAVWNGDWETWLRLFLVACFALAWSAAFFPRRTKSAARRT